MRHRLSPKHRKETFLYCLFSRLSLQFRVPSRFSKPSAISFVNRVKQRKTSSPLVGSGALSLCRFPTISISPPAKPSNNSFLLPVFYVRIPYPAENVQNKLSPAQYCGSRYGRTLGQWQTIRWLGTDLSTLIASRSYATMATNLKSYKFMHSMLDLPM